MFLDTPAKRPSFVQTFCSRFTEKLTWRPNIKIAFTCAEYLLTKVPYISIRSLTNHDTSIISCANSITSSH